MGGRASAIVTGTATGIGAALVCALSAAAHAGEAFTCRGRTLAYTDSYSELVQTIEPVAFRLVVDRERGVLAGAPLAAPEEFALREGVDALFFHRRAKFAGRDALEWISLNRYSGAYAHFIAPRDEASGALGVPLLLGAADCVRAR